MGVMKLWSMLRAGHSRRIKNPKRDSAEAAAVATCASCGMVEHGSYPDQTCPRCGAWRILAEKSNDQ
jgi:rubrerythrin